MTKQEEKGFYWECPICHKNLTDGDNIIAIVEGYMSENTPSFGHYIIYHKECWENETIWK